MVKLISFLSLFCSRPRTTIFKLLGRVKVHKTEVAVTGEEALLASQVRFIEWKTCVCVC